MAITNSIDSLSFCFQNIWESHTFSYSSGYGVLLMKSCKYLNLSFVLGSLGPVSLCYSVHLSCSYEALT